MFKKVATGIVAVSTVGTLVWIGYPYIKALYEVFKKEEDFDWNYEPDFDWDAFWDEQIEILNEKHRKFMESL